MKYIYSRRYQEAAIVDHRGMSALQAIDKLRAYFAAHKLPILNILAKNDRGYVGHNPTVPKNAHRWYDDNTNIDFYGFAGSCFGNKNNYSHIKKNIKLL